MTPKPIRPGPYSGGFPHELFKSIRPRASLRPMRAGVDISPATRGASELQTNVRHGRVRWPSLHVEHAFVLALRACRHD